MIFKGDPRIAVVGLGYVGLPLAVALAKRFETIGLDINSHRIGELRDGLDRTGEVDSQRLRESRLQLTDDPNEAVGADIFIVTVPTPVDDNNRPDLGPILAASRTVARMIDARNPAIVVYESTVYPGVTEDICGPLIESEGKLIRGQHFWLGYSPERINPGDREHTVDRIVKVVAGENPAVAEALCRIYSEVTSAGVFQAASIRTAEAAKVIENAQRDINIAFMNEIAKTFSKIGVSVWDVLAAAGTKWNFLKFQPGLVGGHCIGVDPYYLSFLAQQLGEEPHVILAGRSINDGMGEWIAGDIHARQGGKPGRALVLGLTFKENVPDLRNSKVVDVIRGLQARGHEVIVHDPLADPEEARHEYGIELQTSYPVDPCDLVLCAVPHEQYRSLSDEHISKLVSANGLIADLKGIWRDRELSGVARWSL